MISSSPSEKIEQLITVFTQRLRPPALQRLSVAEILQDATSLAILQEELPSTDSFRVEKQQKPCFGRLLKFLHTHEPTGYERDEEHKRMAVRYLALRTMLQQCKDVKISSIQEICLSKVLRWFEDTEANPFISTTASTPILPPRMSPKKPCSTPNPALGKCSSETSFISNTTASSMSMMGEKLDRYKMPDLRASHIRRIAELRSRGVDISEKIAPIEVNNNSVNHASHDTNNFKGKEDQKRMVEATFKLYHPETDAERDLNLMWIQRRKEDEIKRNKDAEVRQQVHKWAMDRSRDESESLRKRESAKLVAGLEQISQEGVNQDYPIAWRSSKSIHPELAARSNQPTAAALPTKHLGPKEMKGVEQPVDATTYKQRSQKQPIQIVIRTKKGPATPSKSGMHFRNQLPPNYVPPGLIPAASLAKDRRETSLFASKSGSSTNNKRPSVSTINLERRASDISDDTSSSEDEEEDPATDGNVKEKSEDRAPRRKMKFQSYHVPYYYSDGTEHHTAVTGSIASQNAAHPRGTIPMQSLPADPELRCLQEASAMRRVFVIPSEKKPNGMLRTSTSSLSTGTDGDFSSRRSAAGRSSRGPQGAGGTRTNRPRTAIPEVNGATSTSDLRQEQMEEMEKIRRLFAESKLSLSSEVLERGLLVPEDRPLFESIYNLPFAGARLLSNPLAHKAKVVKPKKQTSTKKKKKANKGKKTPTSSRKTKSKGK